MSAPADRESTARPLRWPWLVFALAAAWTVLIRVPLVVMPPSTWTATSRSTA